jgi:hypothetical protein
MKLFDFKPTFFDSQEEAAVYFEHTARNHLPQVLNDVGLDNALI